MHFFRLKKEGWAVKAEGCALLVAGGVSEVRTSVPVQGAGPAWWAGAPQRQGHSREEGAGEGAVEVTAHVAAAGCRGCRAGQHGHGGEAGPLQLPRVLQPVPGQVDARHLIAVGAPGHCHTAQGLPRHRQ